MFENESYVAYFSAPWCNHCETSLDAYDQVLPEGKMMIFSSKRMKITGYERGHNKTETNLNRTIDRPFMWNPPLAQAVGMNSLPFVLFVNPDGFVYHVQVGTDQDAISNLGNQRNLQPWMRMAAELSEQFLDVDDRTDTLIDEGKHLSSLS